MGFSADGRNWQIKATGAAPDLNDIASLNGHFMIAGNNGLVLRATEGPPDLLNVPESQTILVGGAVALSVDASGAAPLTYQWRKDGFVLINGGNISGADT